MCSIVAIVILIIVALPCCAISPVYLNCSNVPSYSTEGVIDVSTQSLTKFGFRSSCPCAYDSDGKCRRAPYMCNASNSTFFCSFRMRNIVISLEGGLFLTGTKRQILFSDPSVSGPHEPVYHMQAYTEWNNAIKKIGDSFNPNHPLDRTYELVVPLRMQWDGCFNHMSFQTLPLIGAVRSFYPELWDKITWHCSLYSAAIIRSLGVSEDRIVKVEQIQANTVLLPWIPHWLPVKLASVHGISGRVCEELTKNLLQWNFPASQIPLERIDVYSPSHPNSTINDLMNLGSERDKQYRYIVYITRAGQTVRDVHKEGDLLTVLSSIIDRDNCKLVVVGHSNAYKTVEQLQRSWQRFAQIFSRAIVIIGPHGGAWNNIIFTPSDCHYIEFNYLPNVHKFSSGALIRSPFLNAYWAKGGSGKFYIIQANNRSSEHQPNIYFEKWARISVREVVQVMLLIDADIIRSKVSNGSLAVGRGGGGLLRANVVAADFPHANSIDVPTAAPRVAPTKRPTVGSAVAVMNNNRPRHHSGGRNSLIKLSPGKNNHNPRNSP